MKKTLFVTVLDGTLLTPNQMLSEYTLCTINALVDAGIAFTYATARSAETAAQVTRGLKTSAPRVLYNGAFVMDSDDRVMLSRVFSQRDKHAIIDELDAAGLCPVVYAIIDGAENLRFCPTQYLRGVSGFWTRANIA